MSECATPFTLMSSESFDPSITVEPASGEVPRLVAAADAWVTASSISPAARPAPARVVATPIVRVPAATASSESLVTTIALEATVPAERRPSALASWSTTNDSDPVVAPDPALAATTSASDAAAEVRSKSATLARRCAAVRYDLTEVDSWPSADDATSAELLRASRFSSGMRSIAINCSTIVTASMPPISMSGSWSRGSDARCRR